MRLSPVVKNLLILNVGFFIAVFISQAMGGTFNLQSYLSLHYPTSDLFRPFQLVTHFFMHAGIFHIAFNMFALAMFGSPVETMWGPQRFLTFYILCAFGSAALHMGFTAWEFSQMQDAINAFAANPDGALFADFFSNVPKNLPLEEGGTLGGYIADINIALANGETATASKEGLEIMREWYGFKENIPMLGASGAVFGVLVAFGMYFPDTKLMLLFLPVPIAARYFIPGILLISLLLGFRQFSGDNIAHFAHLGGALVGFLLVLYFRRSEPPNIQRWDQNA
ncbi:MAG: rhomboid family intramembrane serine protease [Bacteroidota bacterium]